MPIEPPIVTPSEPVDPLPLKKIPAKAEFFDSLEVGANQFDGFGISANEFDTDGYTQILKSLKGV